MISTAHELADILRRSGLNAGLTGDGDVHVRRSVWRGSGTREYITETQIGGTGDCIVDFHPEDLFKESLGSRGAALVQRFVHVFIRVQPDCWDIRTYASMEQTEPGGHIRATHLSPYGKAHYPMAEAYTLEEVGSSWKGIGSKSQPTTADPEAISRAIRHRTDVGEDLLMGQTMVGLKDGRDPFEDPDRWLNW